MLLSVTALSIYRLALRSCPHLPECFRKRIDFFSVLAFRPQAHWNSIFGHQKRRFSKTVPSGIFVKKTPAYHFRVDGRKRRFLLKQWCHTSYVIQRMPCEGFYPTIVLAFPCGRARMICIHYVWMRFYFFLKKGRIAPFSKYPATSGQNFN